MGWSRYSEDTLRWVNPGMDVANTFIIKKIEYTRKKVRGRAEKKGDKETVRAREKDDRTLILVKVQKRERKNIISLPVLNQNS